MSIRYPPPLIQCKIGRTLVTDSDPIVWSGRALQKVFVDPADAVLHQCIRPLFGARCAPGLTPSHRSRRTRRRPLLCPSDAGELVGQRNGEHLAVQSRLRRLDVPLNTDARTSPASAVLGPKLLQLAAEMMRANAGFHPDQARWQIGEQRLRLTTRPLSSQHDRTTPIVAHDVEQVLAVDAGHGDCAARFLRHGVQLFGAPSQLRSVAGLEAGPSHYRTSRNVRFRACL